MVEGRRKKGWLRWGCVFGAALFLLAVGLVSLGGNIVFVAAELDRIVYEGSRWFRGRDPSLVSILADKRGIILGFVFVPGTNQLALGTRRGGIDIRDPWTGEVVALGPPEQDFIGAIASSADGNRIVTLHGYGDTTCIVWDVPEGRYRGFRVADVWTNQCLALSADGQVMALGTREAIEVYDLSKLAKLATIVPAGGGWPADPPLLTPDGKFVLFAERGELFVKDLSAEGVPEHVGEEDKPISAMALSPDGRWVAAAGENFLALWDRKNKRRLYKTDIRPTAPVSMNHILASDVAFSPDGRLIAVFIAYWVKNSLAFHAVRLGVLLLDAGSGNRLGDWEVGPAGYGEKVGFSAEGKLLAVGYEGRVWLLDVDSLLQSGKSPSQR